jgi:hypothetical protein
MRTGFQADMADVVGGVGVGASEVIYYNLCV